jgi:nucleoid-associated protein YgaU
MALYPESRYRYCRAYADAAGRAYLDEREPVRYRAATDNAFHTAQEGDTWWGLAQRYFPGYARASGLWWVICEYQPQPVVDPTLAIPAGTVVVIPPARLLRLEVFSDSQRAGH